VGEVIKAGELEIRSSEYPREEPYRAVWGGPMRSADRSVDVYVHKLRAKLATALPEWRFIHTHFGFGYRFSPEPSQRFHNIATTR
jgi:DNA-binding response OmpR family regulator